MPKKFWKRIDKKVKKKFDGSCYFCKEDNYHVLHVHRIVPGEDGGIYTEMNTVSCCSNCHMLIHANEIKIDRKYFSSNGKWILHYWKNGEEFWN